MELMAVIVGLESVTRNDLRVKIYSDSKYIVDAVNMKWVHGWRKTGFKKKANADLWNRFLRTYDEGRHQFVWVKGHGDNVENNRCDELAVAAYKKPGLLIDDGYESIGKAGLL
jgi:ribonuclease HI